MWHLKPIVDILMPQNCRRVNKMPQIYLVIDACIGKASNAKICRNVLKLVKKRKYHVVMSMQLWDEWDRNETPYAKHWRKSMREKDRLHRIDIKPTDDVRDKILAWPDLKKDPTIKIIIMKDMHLVETALGHDKTIISLDERARGHFKRASVSIDELKIIVWVNPHNEDEAAINWLKCGSRPDDFRKLGYIDPEELKYRSGHMLKRYVPALSKKRKILYNL